MTVSYHLQKFAIMAHVTVPAVVLEKVAGWNILDQDKQKDFVVSWDYNGKMKVGIVRGNEIDDVTSEYDLDFSEWEKALPELQETNELENENYTV
jgi:hypothetical protein